MQTINTIAKQAILDTVANSQATRATIIRAVRAKGFTLQEAKQQVEMAYRDGVIRSCEWSETDIDHSPVWACSISAFSTT